MGLLDTLFRKAGTPVFNPNDPMQGFYDPTEEEKRQARKMAALQAGAGMLMGNTGNYGAFAPALGAGIAQGVQGYQQGLQAGPERRMKEMQQRLYGQQVQAQMQKAKQDAEDDQATQEQAKLYFAGLGIDPDNMQGSFMPVSGSRPVADAQLDLSAMPQGLVAKPKPATGLDIQSSEPIYSQQEFGAPIAMQPPQPPQIESVLDELGYTSGMKKMFYAHAKSNPQAAQKNLQAEVKDYLKAQRSGRRNTGEIKPTGDLANFIYLQNQGLIPPGTDPTEWLRGNRKAGAASATASVGDIYADSGGKKAAETEGSKIGPQMADIENKYRAIDAIQNARRQLSKGIYAGYWGPTGLKVSKATMGALGDREKAARTEKYVSYIGNVVIPRLQEFGGNDSVEELRYLKGVMAGDIEMEPESLDGILNSAEESIQLGIERLQRQREAYQQGKLPPLDQGPTRAARQPAEQQTFSFTAPNGKTYTFPTQQKLDQFKKAAGVK